MKKFILLVLTLILIVLVLDYKPNIRLYHQVDDLKNEISELQSKNKNLKNILWRNNLLEDTSSTNDEPPNDAIKTLKIIDSGYSISSDKLHVTYGIHLANPNKEYFLEYCNIMVVCRNKENKIITIEEPFSFMYALPNENFYYGDSFEVTEEIESVEFISTDSNVSRTFPSDKLNPISDIVISDVSKQVNGNDAHFTGKLYNKGTQDIESFNLIVIYKNKDKIVGGCKEWIHFLHDGSTSSFSISDYNIFCDYDSYDIYVVK